ncbi:amino acid permease [Lactiplantibacillus plantarum]|uniref:amino acid permease n=1 Tax=Lactiplantibacillus plantarum TaxID=1590 RepID=UPI0007BBDFC0|nr:amino acid permease [Lactiplantibacillus plantarum]KZU84637.1 S-methylmethionine permease [Lactiplantibacillus plantarum]
MSKQTHLSRQMESRHVLMISLGGVIGTGLFLSSGYTIHQAGPIGTLLAYTIGAILVYLVMLCLGELSVAMPYTGAFHVYAKKYIGPGTGFTVAILYWLTWTIALGSETKDPAHTIPTAIKTTLWRLIIFFIGSMFVMAALIPYKQAGVTQSPFVLVFKAIGIPYAADLMNFVVLTAIMSAANSGLYASTRMLWSLANEGTIPKVFKRTTKRDVPLVALITSMLGGILALLSSVYAAGSVYLVLVSISGLAVVIVWMAIALSEINFRKAYLKSGQSLDQLTFKTPGYPVVPWLAFILSGLSCILIWFDPNQRIALYYTIPFVAICYLGYYLNQRYRRTHAAK